MLKDRETMVWCFVVLISYVFVDVIIVQIIVLNI